MQPLRELGEADQGDAGKVARGRVDVVREREVDDRERAVPATSARAVSSSSRPTRVPADPVQVMSTSAVASSAARPEMGTGSASYCAARRRARSCDRLTTATRWAPIRATVAVASPAIAPAPRTTTFLPRTLSAAAVDLVDRGRHQGRRDLVDRGLGAGPLADPERLLEERVEGRDRRCRAPGRGAAPPGSGRGSGPRRAPSSRGPRRPGTGARSRRRRSARRGAAASPRSSRRHARRAAARATRRCRGSARPRCRSRPGCRWR